MYNRVWQQKLDSPDERSPAYTVIKDLPLESLVYAKLQTFIDEIEDFDIDGLYPMIIERVERPLIQLVLKKTRGNQVKAASILGLNRNTLRKKIKSLNIETKNRPSVRTLSV